MLKSKLDAVRLSIVHLQSKFAEERGAYPRLATFADPEAVLAALGAGSPLPQEERYALVGELVAAHQRTSHPLWSAILVSAFTPMLLRLRTRLQKPEDEDRDSRVLLGFLYALKTVRIPTVSTYAAKALERATKKAVFPPRRKDAVALEEVVFDEESCSPFDPHAITLAEARAELAWAARRAARAVAHRRTQAGRVVRLPARRSAAA